MTIDLDRIEPPHRPRDDEKLEALAAAYLDGAPVPPIVVLNFDDGTLYGITGSHRLVALREAALFDPDFDASDYVLEFDGNVLYEEVDEDTQELLDRLRAGRGLDFNVLVGRVAPHLEGAEEALEDQVS